MQTAVDALGAGRAEEKAALVQHRAAVSKAAAAVAGAPIITQVLDEDVCPNVGQPTPRWHPSPATPS